jgi:hypothetical protein
MKTDLKFLAHTALTPQCLSAAVLADKKMLGPTVINEVIAELNLQAAAINKGDMTRVEDILVSQAHTLDGLFANLTSKAWSSEHLDVLETYMRLALKAQNQARATLQTLLELKIPKHIAFVRQANIGNQVQVNNETAQPTLRARKNKKQPNELLESVHEQRLDTGATSATSRVNSSVEAVGKKHRSKN